MASDPRPTAHTGAAVGPLRGIRVVVLAGMGPVPFASMLLADMGADVVRVARPPHRAGQSPKETEALAAAHDVVNRGVRTVVADLKDDAETEAVRKLVDHADVFIEGFRPGVAERLGLAHERLAARNPALVYAHLTGYGRHGPLASAAGHDINYVAQSGALAALAAAGEPPRPPVNLLGDYAGGGTLAAFGIVCAVLEARDSGVGQELDAAMIDGVALLTAKLQGLRAAGVFSDEAGTNWIDSGAPYYCTYRCADGRFLAVGALEPHFYAEFVGGLGVDVTDWPAQGDRAGWPRLRELIASVLASRPLAEWREVYAGKDACVSPVLSFDEAAADPHNVERGIYESVAGVLHPAPAPRFERTPARPASEPPGATTEIPAVLAGWAL